jgi:hypothetical protein
MRMAPARINLARSGEDVAEPTGEESGAAGALVRPPQSVSLPVALPVLVVVLLLAIGVGAAVGPVSLGLPDVVRVIGHHVFGSLVQANFSAIDD